MKGKIAIIDDSLTIRNIAKKYISEGGFEVVTIEKFNNIISELEKIEPKLILLDIYLGEDEIDGHWICREIRDNKILANIPVIMMSSVEEKFDIKKAFDSGSNIFIHKPFKKEEILDAINSLIEKDKKDEKILIVDDSSTSRKIVKLELESGGFNTFEAKSGEEGLEILKREKIDLITLDVEMAGMDGFEFSKEVRENPSFQHLPIIMLSSIDDPLTIKKAFEAGIVEYFIKPFNHGGLLNFVEKTLTSLKKSAFTKKAVIIDDSKAQISVLHHILKKNGKEVIAFERALEALTYIKRDENIDIIITDIHMPDMDGLTLSKEVKGIRKNIPVIGISATRSKETVLQALSSGMDDFLYIPFYEEELNLRVDLQIKLYEKIKKLNEVNSKLKELSFKDPLTLLFTRRAMFELLEAEFERAQRNNSDLSIVMFDIDHFKNVNDTYGHQKGDEILEMFANTLKESIRDYDTPARVGGEEFLLLLPYTNKETAFIVAERVRNNVKKKEVDGIKITISGGISTKSELKDGEKITSLIKIADERLYKAKESGRDKIIKE